MANEVGVAFTGDADDLVKESKRAEAATQGVGDQAAASAKDLDDAGESSRNLGEKMGHLGSSVSGAIDAFDAIGGSLQAVIDFQNAGAERASRLAHAQDDVRQATEDMNQAIRDSRQAEIDATQAGIDLEQAQLDVATATKEYNKAVKEHGKNSLEARQASIDLKQANADVAQAQEDAAQAQRDGAQASIDATAAQHDLNDAQREAHPPELQKYADELDTINPILSAVAGVIGIVTAAQWLWNASLLANPITWIILAIIALIAIIVLIATKTTWFQDIWEAVWGFLKSVGAWFAGPFADFFVNAWHTITDAFSSAWNWIKDTVVSVVLWIHDKIESVKSFFSNLPGQMAAGLSHIFDVITSPFKRAFNYVSDAWNNTIGKLSWTVPSWVPFVGGNTISAPKLPHFHTGGVVSGAMGAETLAVLQAGERVIGGRGNDPTSGAERSAAGPTVRFVGNTDSAFATAFMALVRGGIIQIDTGDGTA